MTRDGRTERERHACDIVIHREETHITAAILIRRQRKNDKELLTDPINLGVPPEAPTGRRRFDSRED